MKTPKLLFQAITSVVNDKMLITGNQLMRVKAELIFCCL